MAEIKGGMTPDKQTAEDGSKESDDGLGNLASESHQATVKQNGRFKSVRVKEEGTLIPSQSNASLISSICSQYNEYNSLARLSPVPSTTSEKSVQTTDDKPPMFTVKPDASPKKPLSKPNTSKVTAYRSRDNTLERNNNNAKRKEGFMKVLRSKALSILANPKAFGFQHVCLLLIALAYTLLGAMMFFLIESNYEQENVQSRKAALDSTILGIAKEMTETINDPKKTVEVSTMIEYLQRTYVTLLKQESAYKGSTFYKAEDPRNLKWTFGSSLFFSMNVYTTTGYGSIAPDSQLGKLCVVIYGLIFVPLTLVIIRDLGNFTLVVLTSIYAKAVIRWRRCRSRNAIEEGEVFTLPVILCMFIMLVYLMGTTTFIYVYDNISGPKGTGIDYFLSFYFSFISISTIGLGDIMPENVTFDPVITILFFFGMPLMKVVNSSTYQTVEKATIGFLTLVENRISVFGQGSKVADVEVPKSRKITLTDLNAETLRKITLAEAAAGPQAQDQNINDITIRSVLTFIKSDAHVYGRRFGRVDLEAKTDLV